jgi:hypothetical protein
LTASTTHAADLARRIKFDYARPIDAPDVELDHAAALPVCACGPWAARSAGATGAACIASTGLAEALSCSARGPLTSTCGGRVCEPTDYRVPFHANPVRSDNEITAVQEVLAVFELIEKNHV